MNKIIFLGTASGKTSLERNHTSIYFDFGSTNLLIDCGDGISKSLLKNEINFNSIKNIFISHLHADHFAGIASLITQMKLENRNEELNIHVYKSFVDTIKFFLNSTYMFEESIGFKISYHPLEFNIENSINDEVGFIIKKNSHINKKEELKYYPDSLFNSSSILIKNNIQNIFYTSDIASKEDLFLFKDDKIDILISESMHISLENIYDAVKIHNPQKTFLVHYNDEDKTKIFNWIKINQLSEKIILAKDDLNYTI
ncbi:MBL fold metallo-hydrolase [Stygiobacter electus]|uniref:MBL fold metallo-hydrolase n=1 Tax=Stygiobacter electus TaxID=3032292 RepID=A0AAE3NZ31_9BACT|nr:MBL fold metallo-hydrolase [Stygiobacter electus]MDF1611124.1 MBL fold metallo-hydrolase [Stygiobacter electus]